MEIETAITKCYPHFTIVAVILGRERGRQASLVSIVWIVKTLNPSEELLSNLNKTCFQILASVELCNIS